MTQRHVLIVYAVAVALAVTYVPWNMHVVSGGGELTESAGYGWIWGYRYSNEVVDFGRVILELVGLSIVAGVGYRLADPDTPPPASPPPALRPPTSPPSAPSSSPPSSAPPSSSPPSY